MFYNQFLPGGAKFRHLFVSPHAEQRKFFYGLNIELSYQAPRFSPNPFDGAIFLVEPSRPIAPTIIANIDGLASAPSKATLFAFASILLFSAAMLSLAGWAARQSMKKYTAHV